MTKRIVLQLTSGLRQIVGTDDQFKTQYRVADLPAQLTGITFPDGHIGDCKLAKKAKRYIRYTEITGILNSCEPLLPDLPLPDSPATI